MLWKPWCGQEVGLGPLRFDRMAPVPERSPFHLSVLLARTVRSCSKSVRLLLFLLGGSVTIGACASADRSSASVEVADSAGVAIVVSHGPRWEEGQAWSVSPDPLQTIGVRDGAEEYQLFNASAAARRSDGSVVVVDGGTRTVRLYDRNGIFSRTLGGPGSGPGEFLEPSQVLVSAGDSITVWDAAAFRITRFDPVGDLVAVQTIRLDGIAAAVEPPLYPAMAVLLSAGDLVVRLVEKSGKDLPSGLFRPRSGALRVSVDLSNVDTLMFFGDAEQVTVASAFGPIPIVPPQAKTTSIAVHGTEARVCIGDQEGPEVVCFGPGESRTVMRWTAQPFAVTGQEVAAWRQTTLDLYGQKMAADEVRRFLDQIPVPEVRPHYSGLVLDHAGNLWVEQGPTERAGSAGVDYLVFDRMGALLGTVALPSIRVLEIGDDYVLGIHLDEFEVEYLQVHSIVKR